MTDLLKILAGSQRYTLHSHTEFCDGRAQMEAFAREAVRTGMTHYGFTPHSPLPLTSPCNMHRDRVAEYIAEVDRIRHDHPGVQWLCGMEIDYLGRDTDWGPANSYFTALPLDFRIGSVHFIPNQAGEWIDVDGSPERFITNVTDKFDNDIWYVVDTYFEQVNAMLDAGGFDILGHFDKIALNASHHTPGIEDTDRYRQHIDRLITHIIESGVTVEINTKAYARHGRFYPAERHWPRLAEAGVPIVVNSDAHVPALIDASRSEALSRLNPLY